MYIPVCIFVLRECADVQTGTVETKRGIDPAKWGNKDIAVSGLDTA